VSGLSLLVLISISIRSHAAPQASQADLDGSVEKAREAASIGIRPGDFIVQGEQKMDDWVLAVERIVFKSGGKLIFSAKALGTRDSFYIVAREFVIEDPAGPGTISWDAAAGAALSSPQSGEAVAGPNGGEDADGGPGQSGAVGNAGYNGRNAPKLTLIVS
jgi:hypothetical protein